MEQPQLEVVVVVGEGCRTVPEEVGMEASPPAGASEGPVRELQTHSHTHTHTQQNGISHRQARLSETCSMPVIR